MGVIKILRDIGLPVEYLEMLSCKSQLGKSLKRNLHSFDKNELLNETFHMAEWYDEQSLLDEIPLDSRIKSKESIISKYHRYYPNKPVSKVFNDVLGFRVLCDDYAPLISADKSVFKIADMSSGKANDDGYRGVHLYYQKDNFHYPIEIQFNTFYDRQLNNWLHDYLYKKTYDNRIGQILRQKYEDGRIKNIEEFKEVLEHVLSCSETCR